MLAGPVANVAQAERYRRVAVGGMRPLSCEKVNEALGRARDHSPFLAFELKRFPGVVESLAGPGLAAALDLARSQAEAPEVMAAVRRERRAFALALGIADLAGLATLAEVVETLSDLADRQL